jgi:hypothetical protein
MLQVMKAPLFFLAFALAGILHAQQPIGTPPLVDEPRPEDHLHRSRVRTRLDLMDKLNEPLAKVRAQTETEVYAPGGRYPHTQGLTAALLHSWLTAPQGQLPFPGYRPNRLEEPLSPTEVRQLLWTRSPEYAAQMATDLARQELPTSEDNPEGNATAPDDYAYDYDYGLDADPLSLEDTDPMTDPSTNPGTTAQAEVPDFAPGMLLGTDVVLELVEDRIFDSAKGSETFAPRYLIIRSVNEMQEGKEDLAVVAFRWEDVRPLLAEVQWKNPHNDAEQRTALQILETRQFADNLLNVRGETMETLPLAQRRKDQLTAYEHHLWQY